MRTRWRIYYVLTILVALPWCSFAQTDSLTPQLRKSLWRVGLVNFVKPSLSHELRVGPRVSLMTVVGIQTNGIHQSGINRPTVSYGSLEAQANLSVRYYYNLTQRFNTGKDIHYNSGNYLSAGAYYTSSVLASWGDQNLYETTYPKGYGNSMNVRLLWGHQRRLSSTRFFYDLSGGCQLNSHKGEGGVHVSFIAQIAIGYWFPK
jgi:hypothetical protein